MHAASPNAEMASFAAGSISHGEWGMSFVSEIFITVIRALKSQPAT